MSSLNPQQMALVAPQVGQECQVIGSRISAQEKADRSMPLIMQRKYTVLKVLSSSRGEGFANTACLCAWHTPSSLNASLPPLFKRSRYGDENHVVVVKSRLFGGMQRDEKKLVELQTLRALPPHENVIALYDYFFTFGECPQVHLVLGNMEGNLYQLTRTRRGRALAGGLVSSILHQIALGLDHIHSHDYFHFNLCPENILVTSLGLYEYTIVPTSPKSRPSPTSSKQRDVIVTIKISGFNLACRQGGRVADVNGGFCWYRAPEVALNDTDYSMPVDMWAYGAVIGEILRLQPMFAGHDGPLLMVRIAEMLGAPSEYTRVDMNAQPVDAGQWPVGKILAAKAGITLPKIPARPLSSLFAPTTPDSLLSMLRRLLMYDPKSRLTSKQCLDHPYFRETEPYRAVTP